MKLNKFIVIYILIVTIIHANDNIETQFNYFGNISVAKLSKDGYTLNNYNHDNVDSDASFSPYSKIGGQITTLYKDFTFTAQAIARKDHGEYNPEITWLNAKYDLNEKSSIKVGRLQNNILLNSNSIDIDYIHLWAKPPDEVYRILGINSFDGIEFEYKGYTKDFNYSIIFNPYGKAEKNINATYDSKTKAILDNVLGVRFNVEKGPFTFLGSYSKADLNLPDETPSLIALQDALISLGNNVDRYSYVDKKFDVLTLGLKYDDEDFIFNSEYARMKATSLLPNMHTYFTLLGYRIDKFTPFFMYARNKVDSDHFDTSDINTTADTRYLKTALDNVLYSTDTSQETFSIGFRYDIKPGMAFTTQIDRTTMQTHGVEGSLNKRGILEYELGIEKEPVYTYTIGLSFAF